MIDTDYDSVVCCVVCCSHTQSALAVLVLPALGRCLVDLDGLVVPIQTDETALYLIQYRGCWPHEGAFDVFLAFSRSLNVEHLVVPGQFKSVISGHHAFLRQISLVPHQHEYDILVAIAFDIFDPPDTIAEAVPPRYIEHY